jgi:hypothetical protein
MSFRDFFYTLFQHGVYINGLISRIKHFISYSYHITGNTVVYFLLHVASSNAKLLYQFRIFADLIEGKDYYPKKRSRRRLRAEALLRAGADQI